MAEDKIPMVNLGNQGLEVSKVSYGCIELIGVYNPPVSDKDGIAIMKYAFSEGVTFFDTSNIYGAYHADEILVGKALKHLPREKIRLATKFGSVKAIPIEMVVKGTPKYAHPCCEASLKCLGVDYAHTCCEASLKRLGVDYNDLYYIHRIDTTIPIEETMGELKKFVEEGKVKYMVYQKQAQKQEGERMLCILSLLYKWSIPF